LSLEDQTAHECNACKAVIFFATTFKSRDSYCIRLFASG